MSATIHHLDWAKRMTEDVTSAARSVTLTALSCLVPKPSRSDDWAYLWLALNIAAHRGIDVRVILSEPSISHPATLRNETAAKLMRASGIRAFLLPPRNLLHAKTGLIDNRIAWVGSGNLTAAAALHNTECWMRADDETTAHQLAGFAGAVNNEAREVV